MLEYARRVREEYHAASGMYLHVVQAIELAAEEVVEQDGVIVGWFGVHAHDGRR